MNIITLKAAPRELGKKGARDARRRGAVPCVLYGHEEENVHFEVEDLALRKLVFTHELHRLKLELGKDSYDCILKSVDFDPVRDVPTHADFQILKAGEKIEVDVPIKYVGKAKGQTAGGEIQYLLHDLRVACFPKDIPEHVEIDITPLEIGDTLHISDLYFENLDLLSMPQQSVVAVSAKRVEEVVEPTVVEGVEGVPTVSDAEDESGEESGD
jgi:large subunit ribosomal protein L25